MIHHETVIAKNAVPEKHLGEYDLIEEGVNQFKVFSRGAGVYLEGEFNTLKKARKRAQEAADTFDAGIELMFPVVITLCEPGDEQVTLIKRVKTIAEAEEFLATSATIDPEALAAGYYGIDAPETMINPPKTPQKITYALEPGRIITRNGVPFVYISKSPLTCMDTSPVEADDFAREVIAAFAARDMLQRICNAVSGAGTDSTGQDMVKLRLALIKAAQEVLP